MSGDAQQVVKRPFRFGINASDAGDAAQLAAAAHMAEDLGYEVLSLSDHLNLADTPLAPMVALASVAAQTRTLQLQPMVLANDFRHPAVLAREAATLDLLSQGRFALGLGAGWLGADFHATGIEMRAPARRIDRLRETVTILRGLHSGDSFSYDGEHYRIDDLRITPVPTRGMIPVLIAGSGRVLLSLAARSADTVALNPGLPLSAGRWQRGATPYADVTDDKLVWIREAAHEGKLPELQSSVFAGGITAKNAQALLAPLASMLGVEPSQLVGSPHVLAGSVEHCVEEIQRWRKRWGISYLTFPLAMARDMAPVVAALRGR